MRWSGHKSAPIQTVEMDQLTRFIQMWRQCVENGRRVLLITHSCANHDCDATNFGPGGARIRDCGRTRSSQAGTKVK